MSRKMVLVFFFALLTGFSPVYSQSKQVAPKKPKAEIYYFHPGERCPIDQTIEENIRKLVQREFSGQLKDGTLKFQVINTDDKMQAKTVARFEINAQALYLVYYEKGKEVKKDFTEFAFSTSQSNPSRFTTAMQQEILEVLK